MITGDLKNILDVLKTMAEAELTVAEFYRECAQIWKEEEEFWKHLETSEVYHAKDMNKMAEIISKKMESFEKYRPFNIVAIRTFILGVNTNIQRLKKGEIPKNNSLFIARDIEQSLLERKYDEIVKTSDVEYQTLAKKIVSQTLEHEELINNKIKEVIKK